MSLEVLRDVDARLRGQRFEGFFTGARVVALRLEGTSLRDGALALPVVFALRSRSLAIVIEGRSLAASFVRLALGQPAAESARPPRSPRLEDVTRRVVLCPDRQRGRLDDGGKTLLVPYARSRGEDDHPLVRWARGALGVGLPASRDVPRFALPEALRRHARRSLRVEGACTPLLLLAARPEGSLAPTVMAQAASALRARRRLDPCVVPLAPLTEGSLGDALSRGVTASFVIGDDEGFLHAAAACGAHVLALGPDTLAPPYPETVWVRSAEIATLADEIERLATRRFPWDAWALRRP